MRSPARVIGSLVQLAGLLTSAALASPAYTSSTGKAVSTRVVTKAGSYTLRARAESGGHPYTRYRDFTQR